MYVQITIQVVMLMLNYTKTPTNTGLQSVFNVPDDTFFNRNIFLFFSILVSFSTAALAYIKMVKLDKNGFLGFLGTLVIGIRILLATFIRIGVFVFFFAPFLGLMGLLAHWQADQIPFSDKAFEDTTYNYWRLEDNSTRNVSFSQLHLHYKGSEPPHYSHYTGLGLGQAYLVFWAGLAAQFLLVLATKQWLSPAFRQAGLGSRILHGFLSLNIADTFGDWDSETLGSAEEYRARAGEVAREMAGAVTLHCLANLVLITPIWYTGE